MRALVSGLSPGAVTWRSERFPAIEENILLGFEHLDRRLHALFLALRNSKRIQLPPALEFARPGDEERSAEKQIITDPAELAKKFAGLA